MVAALFFDTLDGDAVLEAVSELRIVAHGVSLEVVPLPTCMTIAMTIASSTRLPSMITRRSRIVVGSSWMVLVHGRRSWRNRAVIPTRVAMIFAMEAEAAPVVQALGLTADPTHVDPRLGMVHYTGIWRERIALLVSVNGKDPRYGVDKIGTHPTALNSYVTLSRYRPTLCINAGTAGGFRARGGAIGDVIVSNGVLRFHDRRIPIDGFREYGVGAHPSLRLAEVAARLGIREGSISTSDSLDATDECHARMHAHQTDAKEMEAAAVAWVCAMLEVPFVAMKSITDLVDGGAPTATEFLENLQVASMRLRDRLVALLELLAAEPELFGAR